MKNKKEKLRIFFDGACYNPIKGELNHQGIGVVAYYGSEEVKSKTKYYGKGTNNTAEFLALRDALKMAIKILKKKEYNIGEIEIFGDSQIIINQFNLVWSCKDETLQEHLDLCFEQADILRKMTEYNVMWIRREDNKRADVLSKETLIKKGFRSK